MENLKDYIALKELLSEATEADFSLLPKEMDTPFTRTSSVTFSEEERIIDTVHKISLPCPVIPRYVRIGSEVLSLYLGKKRGDIEWILRARYCVKDDGDEKKIVNTAAYLALDEEGTEKYYTGAAAIELLLEDVDPFEQAYEVESKSFDPTLAQEDVERYRERAEITAMVAKREVTKDDFVLRSIPVLPFVSELAKGTPEEFVKSKIAVLTYRLWRRARRVKALIDSNKNPRAIMLNETRMVQEAADRLFAEYKIAGIKFVKKR